MVWLKQIGLFNMEPQLLGYFDAVRSGVVSNAKPVALAVYKKKKDRPENRAAF